MLVKSAANDLNTTALTPIQNKFKCQQFGATDSFLLPSQSLFLLRKNDRIYPKALRKKLVKRCFRKIHFPAELVPFHSLNN